MAKTALELTAEERRAYCPARAGSSLREQKDPQLIERRQQAWDVARQAAAILREQFGASRVVVFGSLSHRAWFTPRSDIDLAAWGIPASRFYSAVGAVTGLSKDFRMDLVDPEECRPSLALAIVHEGVEV